MKYLIFFIPVLMFISCKKNGGTDVELAPEITSINPNTGYADDIITITGKNFKSGAVVYFGSTAAKGITITPSSIRVFIPAGSGTLPIKVSIGSLMSNSVAFTYAAIVNNPSPVINNIITNTSMVGDTVTVNGASFINNNSKLYFGDQEATVLSVTTTAIKALIPVGSGNVKISVKNSGPGNTVLNSNLFDFSFASVSKSTVAIGGVFYTIDTLSYFKISASSNYMELVFSNASLTKPIRAFLTTVDLTNQYVSFKTVIGRDSVSNLEKPSLMAARKSTSGNRYIAGTNSDFFNTTTGYPRNANMIDGVLGSPPDNTPITGSYYAGNAIFDAQKKMQIDALSYAATATIGAQTMNIDTLNYYTMSNPNSLMFFNIYCGKTTGTNNARTEVAVTPVTGNWNYNGETVVKVVAKYVNDGNHAVDNNISILSGTGTGQTFLNQLNINDELKVKFNMVSRSGNTIAPYNMAGGKQIIMKNGTVLPDIWNGTAKHPRTGIGASNNGSKIYMCVIDGRSDIAADVYTSEMAQILKYYGATEALNFDGGGSSTMYLDKIGTVNNPSDGSERSVVAGLFAVSSAPDDNQITEIVAKQNTVRLNRGVGFTPVFYGLNKYGQIINSNLSGVTITTNGLGNMSGSNFIAGNSLAYGFIYAKYGSLFTTIKISIE
ncbi:MAG: phosphodiester glycosidase family protein [Niabella sp.]